MRSAGNFSPEWGYLAPAPSFMRTARIVVVATAIGATAGAGVVLSLLDRPAEGDRTSLAAAHAIVTSVQAATAPIAPVTSAPVTAVVPASTTAIVPPVQTRAAVQPGAAIAPRAPAPPQTPAVRAPAHISSANSPAATVSATSVGASGGPSAVAAPQASPGMTALSDPSSATDATPAGLPDGTTVTPDVAQPKKTTHHSASRSDSRPRHGAAAHVQRARRNVILSEQLIMALCLGGLRARRASSRDEAMARLRLKREAIDCRRPASLADGGRQANRTARC